MNALSPSTGSRTRMSMLLVVFVAAAVSCDASNGSRNPVAPPPTRTAPLDLPAPSVTAITPNAGSIGGNTPVRITGDGFLPGVIATLGGLPLRVRPDHRDPAGTILYSETPHHGSGPVDLIVVNPGGRADTLAGAFNYLSPDAFDFDGKWWGYGNDGQDIPILFTVQNGFVTSVSCDAYATLTLSPPAPVSYGEFSYFGAGGVSVTGRIVSATDAVGTINIAPCLHTVWGATKYEPDSP